MEENRIVVSQEFEQKAQDIVATAGKVVVANNADYTKAVNYLKVIKNFEKTISEEFDPGIAQAHKLHKGLVAQKKKFMEKFYLAEQSVKKKISDFLSLQEKIRIEQQRKVEEDARLAEEKRKAELEKQADHWEQKGNNVKAEERRQMAEEVHIPTPIIPPEIEKQEGIQTTKRWTFRIVDEMAIPRSFLVPDYKAIGGTVRAQKDKTNIPGVEVYYEDIVKITT